MMIISADHVEGYQIKIKFADGIEGTLDLKNDLQKYSNTRFYTLTDVENFKQFRISDNGDLEWPNGWDYCKDSLYMQLKGVDIADENAVADFLRNHSIAI